MIDKTLQNPDKKTVSSSTRFCYQRLFYLYYGDQLVKTSYAVVYIGETARRLMTAFPPSRPRCTGPVF
jgi:hypothetical protein